MAFITQLGVSVMLPLLPLYAQSLGASPFVLGLLTSGFAIALAGGQLASGFLTERFAARRLVVAGIGVYAVANVGMAAATAAAPLIAMRALAGGGSGVAQVAERLYVTQVADRARLAFANGILSAAGSAGSVAGPTIGGILAAVSDLRVPFIVVGITSFVATVAGWFLPRPPAAPPSSAVEGTSPSDAPASVSAAPASVSAAPASASVARVLVVLFLVQLAFQAAFGAFITTYAPFADERLGWSTAEIGLVFSLFGLGSVLLGPFLARLADRYGRRLFGIVGCALIFPFAIVYVAELPRPVLYLVTVIGGAGVTTLEASWFALLSEATDGGRRGRAFGTVVALSSLGIVIGSTLASQLWERTGDVGLGMLCTSVAVAAGALALLAHPNDRGRSVTTAGAG
jgi:MFS family permease